MKIQDRKGLIAWFNRHNGTEHKASAYVGVRLLTNRQDGSPYLLFRHNNGVGERVITSSSGEWNEGSRQIREFVY